MKRPISISEAESTVMKVLWQRSPLTAEEIIAELGEPLKWHASTVKTLLARLVKKGAARTEKDGRRFLYCPVIKRDQWLTDESTGLFDRLFGGRVAPLVAHFSEKKKLSKRDIAELKQLIQELGDD
jgi:predicted transcriptional regulator